MSGAFTSGVGLQPPPDVRERLQRIAVGFQAVFLSKMFQAMHETAIRSSLVDPSPAEQTFRYLLDDQLAGEASARMQRGIGDQIYRALCRRLPEGGTARGETQE